MQQLKKEQLWIQILESLHPEEAALLDLIKDGKLNDRYKITKQNVIDAFPELPTAERLMEKKELKRIYHELMDKMQELEAAIYSDRDAYSTLNVDYQDVLDYYNTQPNAEEGL